ncbi:MAG TPA: DUF1289 domain-containing protein [Verrucomicrobiae bacterium]|nr:DUF1289 domain-containing protein [Verrucomicrobiae bacterium]
MTTPASPCTGVCRLSLGGVCRGCARTLEEIAEWPAASDTRKRAIVEQARQRRHDKQKSKTP